MAVQVKALSVTLDTSNDVALTATTTLQARAIYIQSHPSVTNTTSVKDSDGNVIGYVPPGGGSFTINLSVHAAQQGEFLRPSNYSLRGTTGDSCAVSFEKQTTP